MLILVGYFISSVSVQSCLTLCDPMDCSTPDFPVHHQLPEFTQTCAHPVGNAIQTSHSLLSPSPPTFNLSQPQGLFQSVGFSHQVAKSIGASATVLPMDIQDWFPLGSTGLISLQSMGIKQFSSALHFKSIDSLPLSFLYGPTLIFADDYWKNHSFDCMDLCQQCLYFLIWCLGLS